jgi:DNA polymerase IV
MSSFPKILLVDMNSFFASVEQQCNPNLRGKPVGVVASLYPTSCIIAASKEAKLLGIGTGSMIADARKTCPEISLLLAEPEKYRQVNREINRIFRDYTKIVEPYSIDESFLDLRGGSVNPLAAASEIKKRIRSEVGEWLTCSVGIGHNKFLAKLASELKKPDGLGIIWPDQLREVYKDKKLSDLWGISRGWTRRLSGLNITSPLSLLDYPVQNLVSLFGKPGFYLWQRANGLEDDCLLTEPGPPKSFGHSWVLNFRTTDKSRLLKAVLRLAEKAARRMRKENFQAFGFYLSVRTKDGELFHRSKSLSEPIKSGMELFEQAKLVWKPWRFLSDVVWIGAGFIRLKRQCEQLSFFPDKERKLREAIDLINDKYGEFKVCSGLLIDTQGFVPDAVAFGK